MFSRLSIIIRNIPNYSSIQLSALQKIYYLNLANKSIERSLRLESTIRRRDLLTRN